MKLRSPVAMLGATLLLIAGSPWPDATGAAAAASGEFRATNLPLARLRLYPFLNAPLENTLAHRHWIQPAMFTKYNHTGGFGNTTHFAGHGANLLLAGSLGDVIAPTFTYLFNANLDGALHTLREQQVYLTDINQYVPGVPVSTYGQYKPPRLLLESVEKIMGDAYTGMDNGEQDGRYVGEYAGQQ